MKPFWSPLSAILIPGLPSFASPTMLRMLLRSGKGADVVYAGDRMWPALRHGQLVSLSAVVPGSVPPDGSVVLCCASGIPDLLRLVAVRGGTAQLGADADPAETVTVPIEAILARALLPSRSPGPRRKAVRRWYLDAREALLGRPDGAADPALTVRDKYDVQAPFYSAGSGAEMPESLIEWIRERIPAPGRILVAGCGVGRESFAFAEHGWGVSGVDFSSVMVEIARKEAKRRGLAVDFQLADLRTHEERPGSLAGIYFTYDVYSFIPSREDRVSVLKRMASWLAPGGVVLISARRFERLYDPWILTLQRAVRIGAPRARWGQSHTRWISPNGTLHRSFVQVFTKAAIEREAREGGFTVGEWRGNHCELVPSAS